MSAALGQNSSGADQSSVASGFSALDTNGDGQLSVNELTAAIQLRVQQALQAYAQQQQASETSATTV